MKNRILQCLWQGLAGLLFLLGSSAQAQTWPAKPVRLIVPFSAGGATDVIARLTGLKVGESLGQQFTIDNRPGANGNIGTEMAAKSPADGYTIVMSYDGTLAINPATYRKLPFDPAKDLAPIASIAQVPLILVVHPSVPASNMAEFVAYAKANAGKVNFSSAGPGSPGHLTGELLKARAGIEMVHVNYKGGGQAVQDLVGGQIQLLLTGLPTVEGFLKSGKLRALAFTSPKRISSAPTVPTMVESGFPGLVVQSWYGILAPAGTPADVIRKLNGEVNKMLQLPDVKERLVSLGLEATGGSPEDFARVIREDTVRWAKVVADAGIKVD
jgi:tripartite-type tricarboxylate transporter receptor subunit TctC